MSRASLTDITIRRLQAHPSTRQEVFDTKVPGFAVRISPSGTKSFVLFYRFGGRLRRLTLGRYPVLSLAEARTRARRALYQVANGQDPSPHGTTGASEATGFREACRLFVDTYCTQHNRSTTRNHRQYVLTKRFVSVWGDRDVRTITRSDVLSVLDSILDEGLPSAANNALVTIRKFLNWAVERGLVAANPCSGMRRPARTKSRSRILTDEELRSLWFAAQGIGYPFGTIIWLLILTAQRRSEVASLRKADLDWSRQLWTLKPEATKNSGGHVLPLPPLAMSIVMKAATASDGYLFQARNRLGYFNDFPDLKTRLDQLSGVSGWTLHDLRRTAATNLARLGVAPHVIEHILNHRSGTLSGVAGIYNRFGYLQEMRAALEQWQAHVQQIVSPALVDN